MEALGACFWNLWFLKEVLLPMVLAGGGLRVPNEPFILPNVVSRHRLRKHPMSLGSSKSMKTNFLVIRKHLVGSDYVASPVLKASRIWWFQRQEFTFPKFLKITCSKSIPGKFGDHSV
jgi:hypothetical protein